MPFRSRKNVERLKEIFRGDKITYRAIRRLDSQNNIPAMVEQSDLDDALLASKVAAERLLCNPDNDLPMLKFAAGYRLAYNHLLKTTTLVEEYSNEEKPPYREIYRKVRQYEREGNVCFKKRWKAFLSEHGRRGLRQLCDHGDGEFVAAFGKLLDIPGLWDGMRISTVHKMFDMKCDEPALHYLEHIRKTLHKIFERVLRGDKNALRRVDQATIKAFELKAPGYSKRDAQVLQGQLLSGQINFPGRR
ncbi:hypothetical protein G7Y89_g8024 [Cudoniella acicularis]|uniref:Uncharacterized protein n=1 Tax=Cudoniella acicularis TaxID=354080 RepID=A0A8H4RIX8_9HELO|nr:hypothetical protein G7Y89_g8024 [Cudoniella acicularis]